jgi:hypothetical protein
LDLLQAAPIGLDPCKSQGAAFGDALRQSKRLWNVQATRPPHANIEFDQDRKWLGKLRGHRGILLDLIRMIREKQQIRTA